MEKLQLLTSILGDGVKANKDYYQYMCPFHAGKHGPKLGISLTSGHWKCWVCPAKGSSVVSLFNKLKVEHKYITEASKLWKDSHATPYSDKLPNQIELPKNCIPLWIFKNDFFYKKALKYCIERGLSIKDIIKYKIYYCDSGEFYGYIIFPSYDENNKLNFYSGRAFLPFIQKHKIPNGIEKNIIADESMIDWNEPIVLCESKLNAITIKRNACTMYGKTPSELLKSKIISSECNPIYICLDGDATNDVYSIADYFIKNGKDVYMVIIPELEDANSLGYENTWNCINNSNKLKEFEIYKHTINNRLGK